MKTLKLAVLYTVLNVVDYLSQRAFRIEVYFSDLGSAIYDRIVRIEDAA